MNGQIERERERETRRERGREREREEKETKNGKFPHANVHFRSLKRSAKPTE
jgi:hypothetical protein